MPLDPQCAAIIEAAARAGGPFGGDDPQRLRDGYDAGTTAYAYDPGAIDATAHEMPLAAGGLPVRRYRPAGTRGTLPTLVFYHGGGWVVGSLDSHDHLCRHLAVRAGVQVLSIGYRLAPEHRFPIAFEDSLAALHWAVTAAAALEVDVMRLAVGGDSAGGQLAASVAVASRDAGGPALRQQLLLYPVCDLVADNPSLRDNASGYLLSVAAYHRMCDWYCPDRGQWSDPRLSPQHAHDHRGLPPAYVLTAEFDPLRDEGLAYATALRAAGVPVTYRCHPGMIHGFARMGGKVEQGRVALDAAGDALAAALCV